MNNNSNNGNNGNNGNNDDYFHHREPRRYYYRDYPTRYLAPIFSDGYYGPDGSVVQSYPPYITAACDDGTRPWAAARNLPPCRSSYGSPASEGRGQERGQERGQGQATGTVTVEGAAIAGAVAAAVVVVAIAAAGYAAAGYGRRR